MLGRPPIKALFALGKFTLINCKYLSLIYSLIRFNRRNTEFGITIRIKINTQKKVDK